MKKIIMIACIAFILISGPVLADPISADAISEACLNSNFATAYGAAWLQGCGYFVFSATAMPDPLNCACSDICGTLNGDCIDACNANTDLTDQEKLYCGMACSASAQSCNTECGKVPCNPDAF